MCCVCFYLYIVSDSDLCWNCEKRTKFRSLHLSHIFLYVLLIAPITLCALLPVVCICSEKDRPLSIITQRSFLKRLYRGHDSVACILHLPIILRPVITDCHGLNFFGWNPNSQVLPVLCFHKIFLDNCSVFWLIYDTEGFRIICEDVYKWFYGPRQTADSTGPSTLPSGIPFVTGLHDDLALWTTTLCLLPQRNDQIQLRIGSLTP